MTHYWLASQRGKSRRTLISDLLTWLGPPAVFIANRGANYLQQLFIAACDISNTTTNHIPSHGLHNGVHGSRRSGVYRRKLLRQPERWPDQRHVSTSLETLPNNYILINPAVFCAVTVALPLTEPHPPTPYVTTASNSPSTFPRAFSARLPFTSAEIARDGCFHQPRGLSPLQNLESCLRSV